MSRKTKIKFTDFECNLLINGMNEFRNMLLAEDLPTEDVDELLLKIINLIIPPEETSVTLGKWGVLANVTISLKRGFIYQYPPYYHPALLPYPLTF